MLRRQPHELNHQGLLPKMGSLQTLKKGQILSFSNVGMVVAVQILSENSYEVVILLVLVLKFSHFSLQSSRIQRASTSSRASPYTILESHFDSKSHLEFG